ncbi:MAG: hypothetical protein JWM12_1560, partial [Ilumatobacteraceae bacterium]|nr:hypothetical protein [Ilumatobacteraceae bacterium]
MGPLGTDALTPPAAPNVSAVSHPFGTVIQVSDESGRWAVEQVLALAPRPASIAAAQPLAVPSRWSGLGCDGRAVWGRCSGSSAEPYDTVVDHVGVAFRCTCPSRVFPCKHALALLLLWSRGQVPTATAPAGLASWIARRIDAGAPTAPAAEGDVAVAPDDAAEGQALPRPAPPPEPTSGRDDRIARMHAGLVELDRWLDDRVRTGLSDPGLARYATWDGLAARLVDAQVGGLANRIRRLAGVVGAQPDWHEHVLAELGILHLLARAGRHLGDLPTELADSVAVALGWQVRQADVLAGVPETDHWIVMGRSDTREDRIEVRRVWLRGATSGRWAMILSFAAYRQSLDASLRVGTVVHADVFRYPGAGLRALLGRRHDSGSRSGGSGARAGADRDADTAETNDTDTDTDADVAASAAASSSSVAPVDLAALRASVAEACTTIGEAFVAEPWVGRTPVCLVAAPAK